MTAVGCLKQHHCLVRRMDPTRVVLVPPDRYKRCRELLFYLSVFHGFGCFLTMIWGSPVDNQYSQTSLTGHQQ